MESIKNLSQPMESSDTMYRGCPNERPQSARESRSATAPHTIASGSAYVVTGKSAFPGGPLSKQHWAASWCGRSGDC